VTCTKCQAKLPKRSFRGFDGDGLVMFGAYCSRNCALASGAKAARKSAATVALSLFLMACGYSHPRAIVIDSSLTIDQQEAVISAAAEWCERVPGTCVPVAIGTERGEAVFVTVDDLGETRLGRTRCTEGQPTDVFIHPLTPDFRITALHELGHAFNPDPEAEHLAPGNVMAQKFDGTEHLTDADIAWILQ